VPVLLSFAEFKLVLKKTFLLTASQLGQDCVCTKALFNGLVDTTLMSFTVCRRSVYPKRRKDVLVLNGYNFCSLPNLLGAVHLYSWCHSRSLPVWRNCHSCLWIQSCLFWYD